VQETESRLLWTSPTFGLGTIDHWPPFRDSTNVCPEAVPTATQLVGPVQDTASSWPGFALSEFSALVCRLEAEASAGVAIITANGIENPTIARNGTVHNRNPFFLLTPTPFPDVCTGQSTAGWLLEASHGMLSAANAPNGTEPDLVRDDIRTSGRY